jgi:putative Mg2+ transporter-C (MgtC) family protein
VTHEDIVTLVRVLAALAAGATIGLERTLHGRPAGFRTHALVCLASCLLMLVTVYQTQWMVVVPLDAIKTDPTRMAQGIMTGIGFLGAGVIFKEGLSVRGLTTAASIWMTATLGIVIGVGFYYVAAIGTVAALAVLAAFRLLELRLPTEFYAHHSVTFERSAVISEGDLRRLIGEHGFSIANLSLSAEGRRQALRVRNGDQDPQPTERRSAVRTSTPPTGSARVPDRADQRLTSARRGRS